MSGFTYDAGALIAAERRDDRMWEIHHRALFKKDSPTVPAGVLAEVFRMGQPVLERFLKGCTIEPLTEIMARITGDMLSRCAIDVGVVDATVVEGALRRGDIVVTSNVKHIEAIAAAMGRKIPVLPI